MSTDEHWSPEDLGERPVSEKKVRKVRREIGIDAQAPASGLGADGDDRPGQPEA
jgi:tRNA (adenine57-N1/adenine58-N1)-methyltransferase